MCPWCLCLSVQYVVILNHSQLFSILRWWYLSVSVSVRLYSVPSFPPTVAQSRVGRREAETSISPAWELVRSSERAESERKLRSRAHTKMLALGCVSMKSSSCEQPYCSVRDARPTPPSGGSFREGKLSLPLALIAYLNLGALQKFIHVRKVHFNLEGT